MDNGTNRYCSNTGTGVSIMSDVSIREQIKKIAHGDTPDHFMSDSMLAVPDKILALFTAKDTLTLNPGSYNEKHYDYVPISAINQLLKELE